MEIDDDDSSDRTILESEGQPIAKRIPAARARIDIRLESRLRNAITKAADASDETGRRLVFATYVLGAVTCMLVVVTALLVWATLRGQIEPRRPGDVVTSAPPSTPEPPRASEYAGEGPP